MATFSRSKLSLLKLVFPPMSNQEAIWLKDDPRVEEQLRKSDFYAIAGRAEARFDDIHVDEATHDVTLNFRIGNNAPDPATIRLRELPSVSTCGLDDYYFEAGDKSIRIWDGAPGAANSKVLDWFTTEKLLMDRARGKQGLGGLDRLASLATYDLLYVGIAKEGDSFDRLIAQGHKARMEILSNEPQRYPGARVTDEIYLFLFRIEPLVITTFEPEHEFEEDDFAGSVERKRVVADAEKAFVSLLKPQYNIVKFNSYPKGSDGLYGVGYARYAYTICETLTFNTPHGCIKGKHHPMGCPSNGADAIFIDGDKVSLLISGLDFPAIEPS